MTDVLSQTSGAEQQLTLLSIKLLEDSDFVRWDCFVDSCPEATFFHRAAWSRVIRRAFGHNTHFCFVEQNGEIIGVLPLVHINSWLFGNSLISSPFSVLGGVAAVNDEARKALEDYACGLAKHLAVDQLEMRHLQRRHPEWPAKDELYCLFRKELDPDPDANLKAIPRKQRAMVRKGIQAELQSHVDSNVDRLYAAYSESVRNLGTPVFSQRYFQILKEEFGDDCEVMTITQGDTLIASVMSFYFRDQILPYYGGGTAAARDVKGNDFMYWELMRRAVERGIRIFDYGRSKIGTGAYHFKKNWGFEPEPLVYEYFLVKANDIPDINPLNPKYRLFIQMWQRLPLSISRLLGPWLARDLG